MKNILLCNNGWEKTSDNILVEKVDMFNRVHILMGDKGVFEVYESKHTYAELNDLYKFQRVMTWADIVQDKEYAGEFNQIGIIEMYEQR